MFFDAAAAAGPRRLLIVAAISVFASEAEFYAMRQSPRQYFHRFLFGIRFLLLFSDDCHYFGFTYIARSAAIAAAAEGIAFGDYADYRPAG